MVLTLERLEPVWLHLTACLPAYLLICKLLIRHRMARGEYACGWSSKIRLESMPRGQRVVPDSGKRGLDRQRPKLNVTHSGNKAVLCCGDYYA